MIFQVGRAGRFGTKGLAITFVSSASDSDILNQVSKFMFLLIGSFQCLVLGSFLS